MQGESRPLTSITQEPCKEGQEKGRNNKGIGVSDVHGLVYNPVRGGHGASQVSEKVLPFTVDQVKWDYTP